MLLSVANPSAEVREGYESYNVLTLDGQVFSGFKINENDKTLVIRGIDGQNKTISIENIDEILPSRLSLMPSGLLDKLTDQELRDLFAFLSSTTPPR
jgi:putative heme-binding domain-containing protein